MDHTRMLKKPPDETGGLERPERTPVREDGFATGNPADSFQRPVRQETP